MSFANRMAAAAATQYANTPAGKADAERVKAEQSAAEETRVKAEEARAQLVAAAVALATRVNIEKQLEKNFFYRLRRGLSVLENKKTSCGRSVENERKCAAERIASANSLPRPRDKWDV